MAAKLKHSAVLFTAEDGSPLVFQLWPCSERRELRPLIEHGGGSLTSRAAGTCIKLATADSTVTSPDYISTKYVEDCCRQNKLLDVSLYRMGGTGQPDCSAEDIHDSDLSHASVIIKTTAKDRKGRKKFTLEDDKKIISFLMEERRYAEMKGNAVWKDMEILKITEHSYQSMKDRFRKQILPSIKQYSIPSSWMSALTGLTADSRNSPGSSSGRLSALARVSPNSLAGSFRTLTTSASPKQSTPIKNVNGGEKRQSLRSAGGNAPVTSGVEQGEEQSDDEFDRQLLQMSVPNPPEPNVSSIHPAGKGASDESRLVRTEAAGHSPEGRVLRATRSSAKGQQLDHNSDSVTICEDQPRTTTPSKLSTKNRSKNSPSLLTDSSDKPLTTSPTKSPSANKPTASTAHPPLTPSADWSRPGSPRKSPRKSCHTSPHSTSTVLVSPNKESSAAEEQPSTSASSPAADRAQTSKGSGSPVKKSRGQKRKINDEANKNPGPNRPDIRSRLQERRKRKPALNGSDSGDRSGPKAITRFIMNSQEPGSSQESQESAEEGSCLGSVLEESAAPSEVKKHCEIVKKLCTRFGLTPGDVLHALWANSGSLRNTVHWILFGTDTNGRPAWTVEDDQTLESASTTAINALRTKYGGDKVDQRAAFLEDSSLS